MKPFHMRPIFQNSHVIGWKVYTRDNVLGTLRFYAYEWLTPSKGE